MNSGQPKEMQIRARDEELRGAYSNIMQVQHTKEEFCLDFLNIFPPIGTLTARVITSPGHLKRMINALNANLEKYETNFGKVSIAEEPKKEGFGFEVR